jgi:hypothetical protein
MLQNGGFFRSFGAVGGPGTAFAFVKEAGY